MIQVLLAKELFMLFNSFAYILLFVPFVFAFYFLISKYCSFTFAKVFLVTASLFFYGWWKPVYLGLLILSIFVNYVVASIIQWSKYKLSGRYFLIAGIIFNLSLLAYFKYANFFMDNVNAALSSHFTLATIVLPLGISFFTFTQIAFLVDIYRGIAKKGSFINYCLFVSYFPHLLAGPIIHHSQMMPQFKNIENAKLNYKNIYFGILLFSIGLIKKVVIADTFAIFANNGYANVGDLQTTSAWITSLSYTFQIYFDFSGYTDMALGVSKLFNIHLPINFNSPYKALSIQDFWRRWHITLSNFLKEYVYIPLGGNKVSERKIHRNFLLTFILGGIWHGAGWNFIFWGLLHGSALSIQRLFGKLNVAIPKFFCWFITFNFINITWIFFRAPSISAASTVLGKMFSFASVTSFNPLLGLLIIMSLVIVTRTPNSRQITDMQIVDKLVFIPVISLFFLISIISMEISDSHAFIYFQF
jgi:alginate O-acetyltransferase complex protein AlgI